MVVVVVVVMMLMSLKVFDKVSARERSSEIVALYTIYRTEILRRKITFETKNGVIIRPRLTREQRQTT